MTFDSLWLSITFIFGALLHGISGIGFPLVATTSLTLQMSLQDSIVLSLLPTLVLNLLSFVWGGAIYETLRKFTLLAVISVVGSLAGVLLLVNLNTLVLQALLIAVILFYVVSTLCGVQWRIADSKGNLILFGLAAGVLGGATNAMSPLLMIYLLSTSHPKQVITKSANLCFLLAKFCQLAVLGATGDLQPWVDQYEWVIGLTLLSMLGLLIGFKINAYLSQAHFKQVVICVLLVLALANAYKLLAAFT